MEPAPSDLRKTIRDKVMEEFEKLGNRDVAQHANKVMQQLATRIEQLQRVNQRIAANKEAINLLAQQKMPSGSKPFAIGFESPLWDTEVLDRESVHNFTLPAGISLRDAKERLHYWHMAEQRKFDGQLLEHQRALLRQQTKQKSVVDEVLAHHAALRSPLEELDLDLDIHDDLLELQNKQTWETLQARTAALYTLTVTEAAKAKKLKLDQKAKHEEKKQAVMEEVAKISPQELLKQSSGRPGQGHHR